MISSRQQIEAALCELAPLFPEQLALEALEIVSGAPSGHWNNRPNLTGALAERIPEPRRSEELESAVQEALKWPNDRWSGPKKASTLATLASHFGGTRKKDYLQQAWQFAAAITNPQNKAEMIRALATSVVPDLQSVAIETAESVQSAELRVGALLSLVPHLSGSLKSTAVAKAYAAAQRIRDRTRKLEALVRLAPVLDRRSQTEMLRASMRLIHETEDDYSASRFLEVLLPYMPAETLRTEVIARLPSTGMNRSVLAKTSAGLAARVSEPFLREAARRAFALALSADPSRERSLALAALVPHLSWFRRKKAMREALGKGVDPDAIRLLGPRLRGLLLRSVLARVRKLKANREKVDLLAALAPRCFAWKKRRLLEQARKTASGLRNWDDDIRALTVVAPLFPKPEQGQIYEEIINRANWRTSSQVRILAAVIPSLTDALKQEALMRALEAAHETWQQYERSRALSSVAAHLGQPSREEVCMEAERAARRIWNPGKKAQALLEASAHATGIARQDILLEALSAAGEVSDPNGRAGLVLLLIPHFDEPMMQLAAREVRRAARSITDARAKFETLLALGRTGSDLSNPDVWEEALAAAQEIQNVTAKRHALANVLPHLSPDARHVLLEELLRGIGQPTWGYEHRTLAVLAAWAPDAMRETILKDALQLALNERYSSWKISALTSLMLHLAGELREQAIQEALHLIRTTGGYHDRIAALAGLTPHVPRALIDEEIGVMKESNRAFLDSLNIKEPSAEAIACVAEHASEPNKTWLLERSLAAARRLSGKPLTKTEILTALLPHLSAAQQKETLDEALITARGIGRNLEAVTALAAVGSLLEEPLKEVTLKNALSAAEELVTPRQRVFAFVKLLGLLPDPDRTRVINEIAGLVCNDVIPDSEILDALAPHAESLPREILYSVWRSALQNFARGSRDELLDGIERMIPIIAALGGSKAIEDVLASVQSVTETFH